MRLHPDDIRAIASEVAALLAGRQAVVSEALSPAQQMIQLARQGRFEESKQIPKALMQRSRR